MESLAKHGCRKFVLINGRRLVNIPWMQIACERARRLLGVQVALFDPAYMSLRPRSCTAWIPGTREILRKTVEAANGTTGSPTKASREKGKEYHERLTMRRVEVVEQLRAANPGECSGAPGDPASPGLTLGVQSL
jgi:creatinine amidohydrolase/Fe(II)-dependent formamide hydrolase-like protein